jgi:hypothetical protein
MEQSWPGLGYHIGTEHSTRDAATTGPLLGQSRSIIQFSKFRIYLSQARTLHLSCPPHRPKVQGSSCNFAIADEILSGVNLYATNN